MAQWYSRPVLFAAGVDRAADFYGGRLGSIEAWRHVDGTRLVAEVGRQGYELILTGQWPLRAGSARAIVSHFPDPGDEIEALR